MAPCTPPCSLDSATASSGLDALLKMAATVSKTLLASLALAGLSTSAPAPSLEPRGAMPSYVLQYGECP